MWSFKVIKPKNLYQLQDWSANPSKVKRSAFGRTSYIGQLYDAATETFKQESLFLQSKTPESTKTEKASKAEKKITCNDRFSDRCDLLQVEPEDRLTILMNPPEFSGHEKYLTDEVEFDNTSAALSFTYSTIHERLICSINDFNRAIDLDVFRNHQQTEVVVGIHWGVISIFKLSCKNLDSKRKTDLAAFLETNINFREFKESDQSFEKIDPFTENAELIVYSDIASHRQLKSISEAEKFVLNNPWLIDSIDNKDGIHLAYDLVPLSIFKNIGEVDRAAPLFPVKMVINQNLIKEIISLFENISKTKRNINYLERVITNHKNYFFW